MRGALGWRQLGAILILPGVVLGVVPALLLRLDGTPLLTGPARLVLAGAGVALVAAGLTLMALTIRLFSRVGRGTLAPWDPTEALVVRGVYRHVRNPMISGVSAVLLGETAISAAPLLAAWFALFAIGNAVFIPLVEEPGLERRFGDAYRDYRRHVPRWIPRLSAWTPPPAR